MKKEKDTNLSDSAAVGSTGGKLRPRLFVWMVGLQVTTLVTIVGVILAHG